MEVAVTFAHGACVCCRGNRGVITLDGLPVNVDGGDGAQTLLVTGAVARIAAAPIAAGVVSLIVVTSSTRHCEHGC